MTPKAKITTDLLSQASLFTITLRQWGNRRKADLDAAEIDADKDQLHLTKQLIESPEYKEIVRYLHEIKVWALNRCMPSFVKSGVFVVRLDMIREFETKLSSDLEYLRGVLIPSFVRAYPAQVEAARGRLRGQFNMRDYPSSSFFESAFGIEWGWIAFGIPENVPKDIQEREFQKLQQRMIDAEVEIRAALRASFADLIDKAVDKLKVAPGEKPKVFRDSLVGNFNEFFETFRARNLMNDAELEVVVGKARAILSKVTPDALRSRATIREKTASAFEEVKAEVEKLVADAPTRKFREED